MCGRSGIFVHGCQCCTPGDFTAPPIGGCSIGCIVIEYQQRIKLRIGDYLTVKLYETKEDLEEIKRQQASAIVENILI